VGLRTGLAFPIRSAGEVIGVMEFFSTQTQQPDDELISVLNTIGGQIGQFLERRRAEEGREALLVAAQNARKSAEEASRMKDEFLTIVSHELRTPLTAIIGWADLLRKGVLDPERGRDAIEIIFRNALIQTRLVDDLLDLSAIVTGKLNLNIQPVYAAPAVRAAIESIRPAADARSIRIQEALDPEAGPISADADRIQQITWNLLSNAVKFTPGNGRVQVILKKSHSHVELRVSDTGMGISREFLPHVFDRFSQADASSTRHHTGMGVGLAIVRYLVELHGGTVQASSPGRDQGATFVVILPISKSHHAEETLALRRLP
jgi:signal transduction histidine kinase